MKFDWGNKRVLKDELLEIDSAVPQIIEDIFKEIKTYDPNLFSFWTGEKLNPKVTIYILYYILPFYELLRFEKKEFLPKLLTAELLSCLAWRTFDNCIDGHAPPKIAHIISLKSCMHLILYAKRELNNDANVDVLRHYELMSKQALIEMDKPIELQNIWKKCSILLYVPQTLAQLSENSLLLYKNYLNYSGLAHDMNDLVNDIATHTISLPIHWFREVSPYGLMNVKVIEKIYKHATIAVEPIEYLFDKNNIESNFPLMHHLIKDLRIKKHI